MVIDSTMHPKWFEMRLNVGGKVNLGYRDIFLSLKTRYSVGFEHWVWWITSIISVLKKQGKEDEKFDVRKSHIFWSSLNKKQMKHKVVYITVGKLFKQLGPQLFFLSSCNYSICVAWILTHRNDYWYPC